MTEFLIESTDHVAISSCKHVLGSFDLRDVLLVNKVLLYQSHLLCEVYGKYNEEEAEYEDWDAYRRRNFLTIDSCLSKRCVMYSPNFIYWVNRNSISWSEHLYAKLSGDNCWHERCLSIACWWLPLLKPWLFSDSLSLRTVH